MSKKNKKKDKNDFEESLGLPDVDTGSFFERHNIQTLKVMAFLLFIFTIFTFSSLFGLAGNLGTKYFTFITEGLGLYAYFVPLFSLFVVYTLLTKKWSVYLHQRFWLLLILATTIFISIGFFSISGKLGNGISKLLSDEIGIIPTIFILLLVFLAGTFRLFELSIMEFISEKLSTKNSTPKKPEPQVTSNMETENVPFPTTTSTQNILEQPEESYAPSVFSRMMFWRNSSSEKSLQVNHLDDSPDLGDQYEEIEVEDDSPEIEDYRSAMYKAVSADIAKEEKPKAKIKKLVKIEPSETLHVNKKENEEKLRQVNETYRRPPLSIYTEDSGKASAGDNKENARIIKRTLADFGISVEMDEVTVGPTVTRYALKPAQGVKIEKIMNLANNIALELGVATVSITRIPERSLIGIEVPNKQKAALGIGSLLRGKEFLERKDRLTMTLGKDIYGDPVCVDMAKMPHLLIAGTTGSGKSSLIHALINSMVYKNSPYDLKFILIDPKKVEFALYNKLPHLLTPVIKDPKKAVQTLNWLVQEMDRRYAILEDVGKQNISAYHQFVMDKYKKAEGREDGKEKLPEKLPYIVLVIDELADFMMKYPKEMESGIVKLAQMSRAIGIHLILATQRPSTNIITGVIKGNIPSRIALRVASQVDSRVIIDQGGAEKLLGYGDMLFVNSDGSEMKRIQSPFVKEEEIKDAVAYLRSEYDELIAEEINTESGKTVGSTNISGTVQNGDDSQFSEEDEKYEAAKEIVLQSGKTSVSNLQVRLGTGYARSAKLINMLEQAGVIISVTNANGKKEKVVAGHGNENSEETKEENVSNTREDILKIPETNKEELGEEKQSGFFKF